MVHCSCAIELSLTAIIVCVVCRLGGWRELWSVDYCAQCCGFCICWRWYEPLPLRTGYRSHCAKFGWRCTRGYCWSFRAFLTGMFGGSWCWVACCNLIVLSLMSRWVAVLLCIRLVCCLGIAPRRWEYKLVVKHWLICIETGEVQLVAVDTCTSQGIWTRLLSCPSHIRLDSHAFAISAMDSCSLIVSVSLRFTQVYICSRKCIYTRVLFLPTVARFLNRLVRERDKSIECWHLSFSIYDWIFSFTG